MVCRSADATDQVGNLDVERAGENRECAVDSTGR
jgi:hypothetical protein